MSLPNKYRTTIYRREKEKEKKERVCKSLPKANVAVLARNTDRNIGAKKEAKE